MTAPLATTAPSAPATSVERSAELTIVIPTYNERANVAPMVARLDAALPGVRWEAIFVDDDSPDGTAQAVRSLSEADARVRCIRRVNRRGRASACIEGILAGQGRYVAVLDADLQHDEGILPQMLALLREDAADLAIGTRYGAGGSGDAVEGSRRTISRIAGSFARLMLRVEISDPTSGFFVARRDVIDAIAPELASDGFNTLLDIVTTRRLRLRIREVPYTLRARLHGESKLGARVALDFGALLLSRLTRGALPQRFILFCVVGLVGIGVHLVVLAAGRAMALPFQTAQSLAALVSIASNFWLNNILTYRDQTLRGLAAVKGLVLYALICAFGYFSNISVAFLIFYDPSMWWLAGLAGAVISAVWNYAVSAAVVWRR